MTLISSDKPSQPYDLTLDKFAAASTNADAVYVSVSGESMQVLGTGSMPTGRSVTWVSPDVDTVSHFSDALAQTYGRAIAKVVANELKLEPNPGKPLSSRVIERALDMAHTSSVALVGVDFLTAMDCSALNGARLFRSTCDSLGLESSNVSLERRHAIDAAMQLRFTEAARNGRSPVSADTAQGWLRELLI